MELEVVQDINRFNELEEEWNSLLEKSSSRSVFLTWEWLFHWWVHFKKNKKLLILLIKDETTKQIVGIAPFCLQQIRLLYFFRFKKIIYIGSDEAASDFLDFIIYPGLEDKVLKRIRKYLNHNRYKWDGLEMGPIVECSSAINFLKGYADGNYKHLKFKAHLCPYLKLAGDHETFLQSLSSNMRQNLKRRTKCFENEKGMSFSVFNVKEKIKENIDKLFSLHIDRFKAKSNNRHTKSSFSGNEIKEFHYDIGSTFLAKQWLKLYFLNYGDEPIASLYAFKYDDKLYYYQSGFNSNWERFSLGTVLFGYAIKDSINEGLKEFHFLRGDEQYKSRWTKDYRETENVFIFNCTFPGKLFYTMARGKKNLRMVLKKFRELFAKSGPYLSILPFRTRVNKG